MASRVTLYPRVKVCSSPQIDEKENQNSDSPLLPIARILEAYVLNSTMEMNSSSKVEKKRAVVKDSKPNFRASSVPRPRAVLSSPDNDGLIGSRNKLVKERSSTLKMNTKEEKVSGTICRVKTIPIEEGKREWVLKTCSDEGLKIKSAQNQKKMKKQVKLKEEEKNVIRTSQKKRILRVGNQA